ncbi:MAG: ribosome silencing factor [Gemmatimonadota bacterium]|nr:ribosome silencing factor [Gemmatimonadota bacterium]
MVDMHVSQNGDLGLGSMPEDVALIVEALRERHAREPVLLDLRGLSDATDWFVIASGDSDTHARAIAENVVVRGREAGIRPAGVEGERTGSWILIDYISAVVHVFLPSARDFYCLEELWGDAPLLRLEEVQPEGRAT